MEITERRIVEQDWYETELTKSGFDSNGYIFKDTREPMDNSWEIVDILDSDKFYNPLLAIAEKITNVL